MQDGHFPFQTVQSQRWSQTPLCDCQSHTCPSRILNFLIWPLNISGQARTFLSAISSVVSIAFQALIGRLTSVSFISKNPFPSWNFALVVSSFLEDYDVMCLKNSEILIVLCVYRYQYIQYLVYVKSILMGRCVFLYLVPPGYQASCGYFVELKIQIPLSLVYLSKTTATCRCQVTAAC